MQSRDREDLNMISTTRTQRRLVRPRPAEMVALYHREHKVLPIAKLIPIAQRASHVQILASWLRHDGDNVAEPCLVRIGVRDGVRLVATMESFD